MHTSSSGGSSDTEVKLLTVRPTGSPSASRQVTTVTPVAKQPSASRRVRGSCPVRYSLGGGWSAIAAAIQARRPYSIASSRSGVEREHLGDRPLQRFRHQIARLEGVVPVGRADRSLDREGQPLDRRRSPG